MQPSSPARDTRTATLEAFADTIVPGAKRSPRDRVIAGVSEGPGAVAAGAIDLIETPATGITAGLDSLATMLNGHASDYAGERALTLDDDVPPFVALSFEDRTGLVQRLTTPGHPEKDGWIGLALFCNMAFDAGAHLHTTEAIAAGHPGLAMLGFAAPDTDGLWRFPQSSYQSPLADRHPNTTPSGSPA